MPVIQDRSQWAYRQLRSDPLDWPLLGIQWGEQTYLDTSIPFGLRHGASACQRTSEAVVAITEAIIDAWALPYIDDTVGAAPAEWALFHYQGVRRLKSELGLVAAEHKCEPPTTRLDWVGISFDTIEMCMYIAQGKIDKATQLCLQFLQKTEVDLKYMQRFLGKILHATRCTEPARRFTSRLLDLLRAAGSGRLTTVTDGSRWDALWWQTFSPTSTVAPSSDLQWPSRRSLWMHVCREPEDTHPDWDSMLTSSPITSGIASSALIPSRPLTSWSV